MRRAQVLGWGCRSSWGCTQRPRAQGPLSTSQAHRSKPGRRCQRPHPRHTRQLSRAAGASRTPVLRGLDSHCAAGANTERPAHRPSRFSGPRAVAGPGVRPPRSSRGQRPAGLRLPRRAPRVTLPPARSAAPLGAGMTSVRPGRGQVRAVDFLTSSMAIVSHRDLGNDDRPNLSAPPQLRSKEAARSWRRTTWCRATRCSRYPAWGPPPHGHQVCTGHGRQPAHNG